MERKNTTREKMKQRKKNNTLKGPARSSTDERWRPDQLLRVQDIDINEESSEIPWRSVTEDATVAATGVRGAT